MERVRRVNLQVDVFVKEGEVNEVRQSAHLGNQQMVKSDAGTYECVGVYNRPASAVPVSFALTSLGKVESVMERTEGMHRTVQDVQFNALAWLDEQELKEALSDEEREELQSIGVKELNDKVLAGLQATPRIWTPMLAACMAITQHALMDDSDYPEPIVKMEHNTRLVEGNHADNSIAVLTVGVREFTTGGRYWGFCEYKHCTDGRLLYRFTWLGVPESFLAEGSV